MNRRKKTLLLAAIASLCILCGCGKEVIEIDGEQYVKNGEEYIKLDLSPKVFEPGTHRMFYTYHYGGKHRETKSGWNKNIINIPEAPEGYEYVETIEDDGAANFYYMYINVERVEVTGTYNPETNEIEYLEPGVIVKDRTLEMGD